MTYEKNVATQKKETHAQTWFFAADDDCQRSGKINRNAQRRLNLAYFLAVFIVAIYRFLKPWERSFLLAHFGWVSECSQTPTCSEYLLRETRLCGWRGFWRGWRRIWHCRGL